MLDEHMTRPVVPFPCEPCRAQAQKRHAQRGQKLRNTKGNLQTMKTRAIQADAEAYRRSCLNKSREQLQQMVRELDLLIEAEQKKSATVATMSDALIDREEAKIQQAAAVMARVPEWVQYNTFSEKDDWWQTFCEEQHGPTCACPPPWRSHA